MVFFILFADTNAVEEYIADTVQINDAPFHRDSIHTQIPVVPGYNVVAVMAEMYDWIAYKLPEESKE